MIPNEVFHYTKKDIAIEKILLSGKIKIGQLGRTNDPRETKEWIYPLKLSREQSFLLHDSNSFTREEIKVFEEANRILTKEWKVFCTSLHYTDYLSINQPNEKVQNIEYGPFWQGFCRPRMWAYYAENHSGVCLKLDGNKLTQRMREQLGGSTKIYWGAVKYDDQLSIASIPMDVSETDSIGLAESIRRNYLRYAEFIFLTKSRDWETEYEYRWLVHNFDDANRDDTAEYVSIEGVLDEVILGVDFPEVDEPTVINLCKKWKVTASRLRWQNGQPKIQHGNIYSTHEG